MPARSPTAGTIPDKATVYWSLEVKEKDYTRIIGAKYSDGETLVTDGYRGDFSIAKNGSLVITSVAAGQSRFWCHHSVDGSGSFSEYIDIIGKGKFL